MKRLRRVIPYFLRYKKIYFTGVILVIVSIAFSLITPLFVKNVIDSLERGSTLDLIIYSALAIASFGLMRSFLLFSGRNRIISTSRLVERDMRNELFSHIQNLPCSYFDKTNPGELISRAINDVEFLRAIFGFGTMVIAGMIFLLGLGLIAMSLLDIWLTLLSILPLSCIFLVVALNFKSYFESSLKVQEKLADISSFCEEDFSGIRVVKHFNKESVQLERFNVLLNSYKDENTHLAKLQGTGSGLIFFLAQICILLTLLVGGNFIMKGTLTKGEFMAFIAYQLMIIRPIIGLAWLFIAVQRGVACAERVFEILDTPQEPQPAEAIPEDSKIVIKDLSFSYDGRKEILKGINLEIEPSRKIAVVGKIGSGKTTLMNILLRLYPVRRSSVLIGGCDIVDIPRETLRKIISCVPQDNFLFSDTILENVAFGSTDHISTVSSNLSNGVTREKMTEYLRLSRMSSDIENFPHRYEQIIGERGITLSGGQKQRLSIARALTRESSVLILDDAFSNIDSQTEQEILADLFKLAHDKTLIVITHKLTALKDFDTIYVLDEGAIKEAGDHESLMAQNGAYASMYQKSLISQEIQNL